MTQLDTFRKNAATFINNLPTSSPEDNAMAWMKLCKDISVFKSGTADRILADGVLNYAGSKLSKAAH